MTTTSASTSYSIGKVSELTGLSPHALRFYEREGLLLAPLERDSSGRRVFTEEEVGWLQVCTKLRGSGMPLQDIKHYAQLAREGTGNETQRLEILQRHEARVQQQVSDLNEALETIQFKIGIYDEALNEGTADRLWLNGPQC